MCLPPTSHLPPQPSYHITINKILKSTLIVNCKTSSACSTHRPKPSFNQDIYCVLFPFNYPVSPEFIRLILAGGLGAMFKCCVRSLWDLVSCKLLPPYHWIGNQQQLTPGSSSEGSWALVRAGHCFRLRVGLSWDTHWDNWHLCRDTDNRQELLNFNFNNFLYSTQKLF